MPNCWNSSGYNSGNATISFNWLISAKQSRSAVQNGVFEYSY